jgi:hypothetical protein
MVLHVVFPLSGDGVTGVQSWQPVGLRNRRLQIDRSGLFFAAFLPNIQILGGEIVKNYPRWGRFSLSTT